MGELVKQNLGQIFIKNEAKIPSLNTKLITVTEVKMSSDLRSARAYVIPLGGKETKKIVNILTEFLISCKKSFVKKNLILSFSQSCILLKTNLLIMQRELKN